MVVTVRDEAVTDGLTSGGTRWFPNEVEVVKQAAGRAAR
jgi:hypothetical protein